MQDPLPRSRTTNATDTNMEWPVWTSLDPATGDALHACEHVVLTSNIGGNTPFA